MTPQEKLISVALAEVGYIEKASNANLDSDTANAGSNNYNKYARDLDALLAFYNGRKNGYDWCDVFVDWCFVQAFGKELALKLLEAPLRSCGAGVKYSAQYYKSDGRFHTSRPQPGDQIFFGDSSSWWHTGIVTKVDSKYVYTIEGNTSGASGVISNGGGVAQKKYLLSYQYIKGYGRPDWSIAEEEEEVTQEQFNKMMDTYLAARAKKAPSSWSAKARAWAEKLGLIKGTGTQMEYRNFITREEVAEILYRYSQSK